LGLLLLVVWYGSGSGFYLFIYSRCFLVYRYPSKHNIEQLVTPYLEHTLSEATEVPAPLQPCPSRQILHNDGGVHAEIASQNPKSCMSATNHQLYFLARLGVGHDRHEVMEYAKPWTNYRLNLCHEASTTPYNSLYSC
jgi:hypothetical protein